jgi:hypothetical protein
MSDVARLLGAAAAGDCRAAAALLPLIYDELRKLAAARMAVEAPGHTMNATALVHEAYLRRVGNHHFDGRGHFSAAAEAMRHILVNHARDRNQLKRGGGRVRLELLDSLGSLAEDPYLVHRRAQSTPPPALVEIVAAEGTNGGIFTAASPATNPDLSLNLLDDCKGGFGRIR